MVILGCSTDIDVWGIQWPSTTAGSTYTYDCHISRGMYIAMHAIFCIICVGIQLCIFILALYNIIYIV